jgi:type I restriction enzyme, S subunit
MKWKKTRLADIVSMRTGKLDSNASVPGGDYPFFTCAQQTLRIDEPAFDTEAVLLGGNNAAGVFPLKYYDGQFNAYQRTYVIESLDPEALSTRFLFYSLRPALSHFQALSIGAATQYLTKGILDNFQVALPAIREQDRIASILSAYDDLIENSRRRTQLLEQAARLLYKEWFVHLRFPGHEHVTITDGVPEGWERKKIGEFAPFKYGKALKNDDRVPGPFPVYGSSGIIGTHERALVVGPAIIVGRKGNVGSVYWSKEDFHPIDTVYFIEAEHSSAYLYYALTHTQFINTDVAVPGLNRDFAHSRALLIPGKKILVLFERQATIIHDQVDQLTKHSELLAQARDLLLPRLMNGEMVA